MLTNANAVEVAEALGLEIDLKTSDRKAFHVKGYGGLFIWKDGSGFYHSSENVKGNSVALVQHIKNCSYREALDFINENVMNSRMKISAPVKPSCESPMFSRFFSCFCLPAFSFSVFRKNHYEVMARIEGCSPLKTAKCQRHLQGVQSEKQGCKRGADVKMKIVLQCSTKRRQYGYSAE